MRWVRYACLARASAGQDQNRPFAGDDGLCRRSFNFIQVSTLIAGKFQQYTRWEGIQLQRG